MQIKKFSLVLVVLLFVSSSLVLSMSTSSKETSLVSWNQDWSYKQELFVPIDTGEAGAQFQPIDVTVYFNNLCWASNETCHSVRVCCYDGQRWHELESQIYDLEFQKSNFLESCGLVFLIPEFADGNERYFIYYDDARKPSPNYVDHVGVEDEYYYSEPITGVLAEGDYYKITEDDCCVYIVGQKGKVMNRRLSQSVIKMRPGTKEFDHVNIETIAAFCFSYHKGVEDEDEISSDQKLVSKQVMVDGNLMVKFGIASKSSGEELRSTNFYKYYYCPTDEKRICVHVKHRMLKEDQVTGLVNVDGRYGLLASLNSKSERIQKMRFGDALPYIHVYGEDDLVKEYRLDSNPESKKREWVIPFEDDCDLGEKAWFSYDEGEEGKAHGIMFASSKDVVKQGTKEQDGIQIKVAQKEYLDLIGTETDYTSINFGRNSFEKNQPGEHDLELPDDLVVEYDTEFFTSPHGGYQSVAEEAEIYKSLIKYRKNGEEDILEGDKKIYTLTVVPLGSGRILSHPFLSNITGISISEIWAELFQNGELVATGSPTKPLLGPPRIKLPKLASGNYLVKIYIKLLNNNKSYIGVKPVTVNDDETTRVFCTWDKQIQIQCNDQHNHGVDGVQWHLLKNNTIVAEGSSSQGSLLLHAPFNLFQDYRLVGFYKGFKIFDGPVSPLMDQVNSHIDVYPLEIKLQDKLGLTPGVNIKPFLTSEQMNETRATRIKPDKQDEDSYYFEAIPGFGYDLHLLYGSYYQVEKIDLPQKNNQVDICFTALYNLNIDLFDKHGNQVESKGYKIDIIRDNQVIHDDISSDKKLGLPPGEYTIHVYDNGRQTGLKNVLLTNDKDTNIVTQKQPVTPMVVTGVILVFIAEILVLLIIKKLRFKNFLKLIGLSIILISLFQPWWVLQGDNPSISVEKETKLFFISKNMVESVQIDGDAYLELSTIPVLFTDFLNMLLVVIAICFVIFSMTLLFDVFYQKNMRKTLIVSSIIFLMVIGIAFSYGMSRICEISVGSIVGQGDLNVVLPTGETALLSGSWGFGMGFYLCLVGGLFVLLGGLWDYLRQEKWPKTLRQKLIRF